MAEIRREIRLYLKLRRAALRGAMQYRGNILMMVLAGAAYQGSGFAFVWALLHTFGTVAGWGLGQIAFLYGMRLLSHALWLVTLDGVMQVDYAIREGHLDRMLLRPVNVLSQLATTTRSLLPFGDLSMAIVVFGVAVSVADLDWSPGSVAFLVLAVIGGAMIEGSVAVTIAGFSVRVLDTWAYRLMMFDAMDTLGSYPLSIFGSGMQRTLTYVLPVAFVAFLPASVILGRTGQLAVPAWLGYATPVVGATLFTVAYRFWRRQLRGYQGVGH
ncbi:ABC transporter permease [Actinoplanes regularis]|uniref:ABC-2 type transport system permease protein n=1 Tax=Actinoplanes regularis TaxID=52697 RepID=A0A238Y7F4_9ACTN|nr:ABC-2 family transporter protein [Actinoplanes regularis]GIE86139.1 ABC transporter permease [Actinoplanes regularis]SNR66758.1 ABC-2 type transport system permease protein [Actinoplanes regularis]